MDEDKHSEISQDTLPSAILELFKDNREPVTKEALAHVIAALLRFEAHIVGSTSGARGDGAGHADRQGPYEAYRDALHAAVSLLLGATDRKPDISPPAAEPVAPTQ